MGGCKYLPKTGGFWPKWESWNLWHLRGWRCACCWRPRQLALTYSQLLFSRLMTIMMIINGYLLNLEIVLVLEMFADTGQDVIQCGLQLAWGFPPRSKLTLRKVFHPAFVPQPLFRQNLLMLKLMWQFVLNRAWQIARCMFISGSNNRGSSIKGCHYHRKEITTSLGWFCKLSLVILLA